MATKTADVRQALADAITNGTGLRSYPYGEADQLNPPCAAVYRDETDPRTTFGDDHSHWFFKVRVYVGATSARSAVALLDDYADHVDPGKSIALAVADGDNWPDNLVDYAQVFNVGPVLIGQLNGQQETYLMQEFDVEVVW